MQKLTRSSARTSPQQGTTHMRDILQHLKQSGEQLDSQIAAATGIPIAQVRRNVSELSAKGDVIVCRSIR